jgi:UDP-N-acetylmuramate--alanine ligase
VAKATGLLIEADESDGTLVKYKPEIGLLLSIDKDHKELEELFTIFDTFKNNCQTIVYCQSFACPGQTLFKKHSGHDFGAHTRFEGTHFQQQGFHITFEVQNLICKIPTIGIHNMENALACMAVADLLGVNIAQCISALANYEGIYRRHQLLGIKKGITVIDDYAHNPAKIAASIKACQPVAKKLIAWFQPHGYGPTRFIRKELVTEIASSLRPHDEIWMSEIYYAGGTAVKDISANDLIQDLKALGVHAYFVEERTTLFEQLLPTLTDDTVLLLMGARDPGLEKFSKSVYEMI